MKCIHCKEHESMDNETICGLCEKLRNDAWLEQIDKDKSHGDEDESD